MGVSTHIRKEVLTLCLRNDRNVQNRTLKTEKIIRLKKRQRLQTARMPNKTAPTILFCIVVYSVKNKQITCEGCASNSMDEVLPMQA